MTSEDQYIAWVKQCGGSKPIRRILLANNGMAAAKFTLSIRNWLFESFGDDKLIHIMAMATPEDMKASARHIDLADAYYEAHPRALPLSHFASLPLSPSWSFRLSRIRHPRPLHFRAVPRLRFPAVPISITMPTSGVAYLQANSPYFDISGDWVGSLSCSVITALAKLHKADAVWPGWGHASENPALPRTLAEMGIIFIGPSDNSMFLLGDKIASTIIAQSARVPCVSWSGSGVTVEADEHGRVSDEVFAKACVNSAAEALEVANQVGYPIMLKASEGGGGKGVRKAITSDQIETILALMVDYTHAGTVEYLFLEETNEFFFLELNPRLQVEHPVTEGITGCNVPSLQLMVAMGCDLTKMTPDVGIDKYIVDFDDASPKDPFAKTNGHVIAVRITAENAADGWKPTVGQIANIEFQSLPKAPLPALPPPYRSRAQLPPLLDAPLFRCAPLPAQLPSTSPPPSESPSIQVWGYFSVKTPNAEVHAYADSQFGHIFAHGRDRKEVRQSLSLLSSSSRNGLTYLKPQAGRLLTLALKRLRVVGEIHTNIAYVQVRPPRA
ncbi:MAG: hypothetical protein SGPRY_012631 [Prymnesium sp.]